MALLFYSNAVLIRVQLLFKIRKGYLEATRGYVNKSHIHEVPQNNWLIFHMGEVSHGQGINRDMILFVVLTNVH